MRPNHLQLYKKFRMGTDYPQLASRPPISVTFIALNGTYFPIFGRIIPSMPAEDFCAISSNSMNFKRNTVNALDALNCA